jgi:hypothetical protein
MTTPKKTLVVLAVGAVLAAGLMIRSSGTPHEAPPPATSSTPAPSPSPSTSSTPTEPAMTAALSTPYRTPPFPLLWPSPPPVPTEEQLRDMVRKEMDEAYRRGQEEERQRAEREKRETIPPVPQNPWESEEDRALKARKYGFQLLNKAGVEWGRIHRVDGDDIVKGLFPETTAVESKAKPVVTEKDGAWTVTFEPLPEAKP